MVPNHLYQLQKALTLVGIIVPKKNIKIPLVHKEGVQTALYYMNLLLDTNSCVHFPTHLQPSDRAGNHGEGFFRISFEKQKTFWH